MNNEREIALSEERLGNALLELEKVKGKYSALNSAYKELLEQLFQGNQNEAVDSEGSRHIFYSKDDLIR